MNLTPELRETREEIEGYAREFGLDFFETIFEVVDYEEMNQIASYGGFPNRYPHWRFGMEYDRLSKAHAYGLQKIYEMVVNTDPAYAYLLEGNELVDQKTVMAHVFAHVDFFKNNLWFSQTNRKMMDETANHASRIRRHIDRHGLDQVEAFLDVCLSLDNLIDRHAPFVPRKARDMGAPRPDLPRFGEGDGEDEKEPEVPLLRTGRDYMRNYLNPADFVEEQRRRLKDEVARREERFPVEPVRDVLYFLMEHAPLKSWQLDILGIIREEAYYFAPQGQTKILNEGWATYWHSRIMTGKALKGSEVIDYASHHAGTLATSPARVNPYKLGVELLRHVEDRWNRGEFGKTYEECDDLQTRSAWNRNLGLGREKLFQIRRCYNDVTFIDEFLTPEFCAEQKLFTYAYNRRADRWEIASREFREIKEKLLFELTNFGQPHIFVEDANYRNRGELLLLHRHEGIDLRPDYARDTLVNLHRIWKRPVHVRTVMEERPVILGFDGTDFEEKSA